ncbi:MAG: hypothetical protein SFW66_00355 [Gammaproteobacteria bacterium]|nr:hypothetical protein [Gammaproteobacteria bacterium]
MLSTNNNLVVDNDSVLKEILPLPAEKVIADRFSASSQSESAACTGRCGSGVCRTFV